MKNQTNFEHKHDEVYLGACPETTCNDNYVGEAKRRISKRVKDHNGRFLKLYPSIHALENDHQHVLEKDFKIIGHGCST